MGCKFVRAYKPIFDDTGWALTMWDVNFTLIADGLNGVWRWALTMWDVNLWDLLSLYTNHTGWALTMWDVNLALFKIALLKTSVEH